MREERNDVNRGTGILNNKRYIGVVVWGRNFTGPRHRDDYGTAVLHQQAFPLVAI
jgi:hypothetical protein